MPHDFSSSRTQSHDFDAVSVPFIRLALRGLRETAMDYRDNDAFFPTIVLRRMPQRVEVRAPEDDWAGVTDPLERRKLQNLLNPGGLR